MNALKHGITARTTVIKGESPKEYRKLVNKLRAEFNPQTAMEDYCVEQISQTIWKQGRKDRAEAAEIDKVCLTLDWKSAEQEWKEARQVTSEGNGLLYHIANGIICQSCINALKQLKVNIELARFCLSTDEELFNKLYGQDNSSGAFHELNDVYKRLYRISILTDEQRQKQREVLTAEQCKLEFLKALKKFLRQLQSHSELRNAMKNEERQLQQLSTTVLHPKLDVFRRYTSHLDRRGRRYLELLEKLRKMRPAGSQTLLELPNEVP